ncbi:carboxylesterase-like protein [Fusarium solani]|uniref:Carboxylic ester hydrolase n=2 Tax=Fusarium solani TaxID=169388 RepID=A0A9P9JSC9_FUSSL|nr:carboxylesterase-like protein [Fusarium solani]KAH7230340.1 carboxylesterase-like protein [Fusarium solani]
MPSFVHPSIGRIAGNTAGACTQFLGIKYAQLKDRFASPEPIHYDGSGIDATKYGPQVVSPPSGVDIELGVIQKPLPKPEFPGVSDVSGLTLNITVPSHADGISKPKDLPVLVFIHGGGFALGGSWWPQYNFARFVTLSADLNKPVIGITINYRLGAPGFLTSPELRKAGYKPNNGLRDQRAALRWIKKHIGGFGGDPEDITVMGQSAGGVSAGYLLLSQEPLAKRLVCLSGCPPFLGQLPLQAADQIAKQAYKCLGQEDLASTEQVQRLLEIPAENFWTLLPMGLPMLPVIDGDIIPQEFDFRTLSQGKDTLPGTQWVEGLLIGDSKLDGSIMAYLGLLVRKDGIAEAFRNSATRSLADYPDALAPLLEHYSLSESATKMLSDDESLLNILKFISDAAFYMPLTEFAAKIPNDAFVFAFNEPNPWDGLFKGHASHILDVAFLFQNYNEYLSEEQRASAKSFGVDVITFVNGEAPWKAFNRGQHGVAVYCNGGRKYYEPADPEKISRDTFILKLATKENGPGMKRVMQVFTDFLA